MNQLEKFNETVGILVKAYLEGTLRKGQCSACAVGNICAAALGATPAGRFTWKLRSGAEIQAQWQELFCTDVSWAGQEAYYKKPDFNLNSHDVQTGLAQIEATGYTIDNLARVEYAFETALAYRGSEAEYAGLMAVVDVLADIHSIDLATATEAKALFVKA